MTSHRANIRPRPGDWLVQQLVQPSEPATTDFQISGAITVRDWRQQRMPCSIERRTVSRCLILLVKAIRVRVRNPQSLRVRDPDHLFSVPPFHTRTNVYRLPVGTAPVSKKFFFFRALELCFAPGHLNSSWSPVQRGAFDWRWLISVS